TVYCIMLATKQSKRHNRKLVPVFIVGKVRNRRNKAQQNNMLLWLGRTAIVGKVRNRRNDK
ncbi:MAG: hypothetical protein K2L54_01215, partial [Clostridiales bacterium]|nr:hypothetical protein [Clostridiales bacterium]